MNKTPEHILQRNREYRKRVKYHLKRDKKKQSEYVKKSQKNIHYVLENIIKTGAKIKKLKIL